ncbi:MAG: rod shape-determining protein MreD [Mangrovicoccus sp.]
MDKSKFFALALYQLLFTALAALFLLAQLLPLDTVPGGWPGPDLLLCLACAWVLRAPAHVPFALLAALFFAADLLLQRPPGLWTALALIVTEILRVRQLQLRPLALPFELGLVAIFFTGMTFGQWAILGLTFADQPRLGMMLLQNFVTLLAYPLVVMVLHGIFGIRKRSQTNIIGNRARA